MIIKKNATAEGLGDDSAMAISGGKTTYHDNDYTTFVALMEDHLETVRELERYRTKFEMLHKYLEYHFVDDPMVRIIAGDLE